MITRKILGFAEARRWGKRDSSHFLSLLPHQEQVASAMLFTRLRPFMSLLAGASLMGGAVLATSQPAVTSDRPLTEAAPRLVHHFAPGCIGYCHHPTNAAKVFRWGREAWRQEFEDGPLNDHWHTNHPRLVKTEVG